MRAAVFALVLLPMTVSVCAADPFGEKVVPGRFHDFGVVKRDVELKHSFVLLNPYNVAVEIESVRRGG